MTNFTPPKLSLKEQTFFAKRLSFLMSAGVPLSEGLEVLHSQARGHSQQRLFAHIARDVSSGQLLSKSLAKFPRVFGDFSISLVRVGEASGTLSFNLEYLAQELKKRNALRGKVLSALLYPLIIGAATLGIVAFLMLYLFPKLLPVFESLHVQLPLTTRIVIAFSSFLRQWGLVTLILLICVIAGLIFVRNRSKTLRAATDRVLLSLPLVGSIARSFVVANSCRTLSLLLKSGIKVEESFLITADATGNLVYKNQYRLISRGVARGEKISVQLRRHPQIFPDIMTHLVAVGEQSGSLSDTLSYLSELYEAEVDEYTKNISTLVEPVLMIVMGLIVGFIAVSIITPLYGITQNLHA